MIYNMCDLKALNKKWLVCVKIEFKQRIVTVFYYFLLEAKFPFGPSCATRIPRAG